MILQSFIADLNRECSREETAGYAYDFYLHNRIVFAYLIKPLSSLLVVNFYVYHYRDVYLNQQYSSTATESGITHETPLSPNKQYVLSIHSYVNLGFF